MSLQTKMEIEKDTRQLVKEFLSLQDERVEAYNLFEEGFTAYLKGAPQYNFDLFKQLVAELTSGFNSLSKAVMTVSSSLLVAAPALSRIINSVQQLEQKKLEATTELQIARQEEQDRRGEGEAPDEHVSELNGRIKNIRTEIFEQLQDFRYEAEEFLT